ncbi:MAG: sulfotransferase [Planctomycetes bacterium]|nr:sulfotransferase [Planctomycetota bacterium]
MLGFSTERRARLAAERPVVIMGRGHSGTRVLAWALEELGVRLGTLAEKDTGDAQDRRFTRRIKRLARRSLRRDPLAQPTRFEVWRFARRAEQFRTWIAEHPPVNAAPELAWGWKFPETYLIGPLVEAVFPQALYVHMVRDGRDLAFKEHLTDDADRALGRALLAEVGALEKPHHIQAALSWNFQVQRFDRFAATLGERCLRLRFEDLIAEPERTMERTAEFLKLPMNERCRAYLRANLRRGKVSQHRSEDPSQIAEVEALIAPTLREWGYALRGETGEQAPSRT